MPMVEITVNGRRHMVQCGQGEEGRVRQLAAYVDRQVADLARGQTQVGDARLLLMASLLVADKLSDAFEEIKQLKATLDERTEDAERRAAAGGRGGRPAARHYCRAAGESLTNQARVLPGALGPRHPWGQCFSVRELSLPGPWPRYYGAHLRRQATEDGSDRRPWRPRTPLSSSSGEPSTIA